MLRCSNENTNWTLLSHLTSNKGQKWLLPRVTLSGRLQAAKNERVKVMSRTWFFRRLGIRTRRVKRRHRFRQHQIGMLRHQLQQSWSRRIIAPITGFVIPPGKGKLYQNSIFRSPHMIQTSRISISKPRLQMPRSATISNIPKCTHIHGFIPPRSLRKNAFLCYRTSALSCVIMEILISSTKTAKSRDVKQHYLSRRHP